jgi:cell division protease FtsH
MDSGLMLKEQLEDMIVGLLGGRAAEELTFGQITTGASNDLERTTSIARAMVMRYGMSDKLGLRVYGDDSNDMVFLGRNIAEQRDYSDETARTIDEEVNRIIDESYDRAKQLLTHNGDKLENLAQLLLEVETVDRTLFETLMEGGEEPIPA